MVAHRRELKVFLGPQAEKSPLNKAFGEHTKCPVLEVLIEVNEHVPTEDQVHLTERSVRDEIVIGKGNS